MAWAAFPNGVEVEWHAGSGFQTGVELQPMPIIQSRRSIQFDEHHVSTDHDAARYLRVLRVSSAICDQMPAV